MLTVYMHHKTGEVLNIQDQEELTKLAPVLILLMSFKVTGITSQNKLHVDTLAGDISQHRVTYN